MLRAYGDTARDEEGLVMGLLLPDAPVVAWWPRRAPIVPGESPLGRIAQRRITDAAAQPDPQDALADARRSYPPGDTDFAWTRLTLWRAQLAAVLDQPPYEPVTGVTGHGSGRLPLDRRCSRPGSSCSSRSRRRTSSRRRRRLAAASTACASSATAAPSS